MNIIMTTDQYKENYVFFCDPIKNNIMNDGQFIRIVYSTPFAILNGIYMSLNVGHINIEKYYNKFKCSFDLVQHGRTVDKIQQIEENLLQKINIQGKTPKYKIYEQLITGHIKVFSDAHNNMVNFNSILLKIAGIWETEYEYGLTYKFLCA